MLYIATLIYFENGLPKSLTLARVIGGNKSNSMSLRDLVADRPLPVPASPRVYRSVYGRDEHCAFENRLPSPTKLRMAFWLLVAIPFVTSSKNATSTSSFLSLISKPFPQMPIVRSASQLCR